MCEIVDKEEVKGARDIFDNWINKVHEFMKNQHNVTFRHDIIGSGKRRLVIRQCNRNGFFDLDYQITLKKLPAKLKNNISKKAKEIKRLFQDAFDETKPDGFTCCEDSTQALTTKSDDLKIGFDIIIIREENSERYILYNNKDVNDANNNDYSWEIRSDDCKYRERMKKIKKAEKWDYLRNHYRDKRHDNKDKVNEEKKKSYQILNEAVVDTLNHFNIKFD